MSIFIFTKVLAFLLSLSLSFSNHIFLLSLITELNSKYRWLFQSSPTIMKRNYLTLKSVVMVGKSGEIRHKIVNDSPLKQHIQCLVSIFINEIYWFFQRNWAASHWKPHPNEGREPTKASNWLLVDSRGLNPKFSGPLGY